MKESARARSRRVDRALTMRELRPRVLVRDGYACRAVGILTGRCSGPLAVHHRYIAHRVDTEENLITLCLNHHTGDDGVHSWRQMAVAYDVGLLLREADGPPVEAWTPAEPLPALDWWD